jgi:hypothetical protein
MVCVFATFQFIFLGMNIKKIWKKKIRNWHSFPFRIFRWNLFFCLKVPFLYLQFQARKRQTLRDIPDKHPLSPIAFRSIKDDVFKFKLKTLQRIKKNWKTIFLPPHKVAIFSVFRSLIFAFFSREKNLRKRKKDLKRFSWFFTLSEHFPGEPERRKSHFHDSSRLAKSIFFPPDEKKTFASVASQHSSHHVEIGPS